MLGVVFIMSKEYTHKERAKNLIADFQKEKIVEYTAYAGGRTEYSCLNDREAKKVTEIALNRNISNLSIIVEKLKEKGHIEIAEHFEIVLEDEKCVLSEVERL